MSTHPTPFLDKAKEALRSAELLLENGLLNCATNRAYFAVFHAAKAALIAAGVSDPRFDWTHEKLQAQFPNLIHRRKMFPADLVSALGYCRSLREHADYDIDVVSSKDARNATKVAARFVSAVQEGITR